MGMITLDRSGDVFVVTQGQRHCFFDDKELRLYNIMFDPRRL